MLTHGILLLTALLLKIFIIKDTMVFSSFFNAEISIKIIIILLAGSLSLIGLQLLFIKFVPEEKLFDQLNMILMERFSLSELFVIFLIGAFTEELLFRGMIQPFLGIILTCLVFVGIHFRYFSKKIILLEIFLMGIILGIVYQMTNQLYVPVICHLILNFFMAVLIKKGYLNYERANR